MTWNEFWVGAKQVTEGIWQTADGGFWWIDETGADGFGPYPTAVEATVEQQAYGEYLNGIQAIHEVLPRNHDQRDWVSNFVQVASI